VTFEVTDFTSIIAALIAAGSLWIAYIRWRSALLKDQLSVFRSDLTSFRSSLETYGEALNDTLAFEVGFESGKQIVDFSGKNRKDEFESFLSECEQQDVFIGSLLYGLKESRIHHSMTEAVATLREIGSRHNERFPVTARLLDTFARYASGTVSKHSMSLGLNAALKDEDTIAELVRLIPDQADAGILRSNMSDFYSSILASSTRIASTPAKMIIELMGIVIANYLQKSDAELTKLSNNEKLLVPKARSINTGTYTGDIEELTELLSHVFDKEEWTKVVTLRTKLSDHYATKSS